MPKRRVGCEGETGTGVGGVEGGLQDAPPPPTSMPTVNPSFLEKQGISRDVISRLGCLKMLRRLTERR